MQNEHKADARRLVLIKEIETLEAGKLPLSCKAHSIPFVAKEWASKPSFNDNKTTSEILNDGEITLTVKEDADFADFRRQVHHHGLFMNRRIDLEAQTLVHQRHLAAAKNQQS